MNPNTQNIDDEFNELLNGLTDSLIAGKDEGSLLKDDKNESQTEEEKEGLLEPKPEDSEEPAADEPVEGTAPEEPQEEAPTTEEQDSLPPVDERLEQLKKQYGVEESTNEPAPINGREVLKQHLNELQNEEARLDPKNYFKSLPMGDLYVYQGRTVYELDNKTLNDYLIDLKDSGQEFQSALVQKAVLDGRNLYGQYQNDLAALEQKRTTAQVLTHTVEWEEVANDIIKQLPELEQHRKLVGDAIDEKINADANFAQAVLTKEGKAKKAVEVILGMGLLNPKAKEVPEEKHTTSTPPDARVVSKKVKTSPTGAQTYREADILKMSQAEFNKLPDDVVDKLLWGEGVIKD